MRSIQRSLTFAAVVLFASSVAAAVPDQMPFQAFLATSSGVAAPGPYAVTVRIFDAQTGGAQLYAQGPATPTATDGVIDLVLGPLPASVTAAAGRWVEVQVESEPPLPRRPLLSGAFAQRAGRADVADSLSCSRCVGSTALGSGAVKAEHLGVPWAAAAGAGGDAAGLACSGCVEATDLAVGSVASAHIQDGAVASADVAFPWAAGTTKGGPAADLACTGCVQSADLAPNLELVGSLAVDGTTLFVDGTTHRVGVGTASPGSTLHAASSTFFGTVLEQTGNGVALEVRRSGSGEGPNDPVLRVTEQRQGGGSTQGNRI